MTKQEPKRISTTAGKPTFENKRYFNLSVSINQIGANKVKELNHLNEICQLILRQSKQLQHILK